MTGRVMKAVGLREGYAEKGLHAGSGSKGQTTCRERREQQPDLECFAVRGLRLESPFGSTGAEVGKAHAFAHLTKALEQASGGRSAAGSDEAGCLLVGRAEAAFDWTKETWTPAAAGQSRLLRDLARVGPERAAVAT